MAIMVIYRQKSEYGEKVEEFLHDFRRRTLKEIETISPDSPRGAELSRIYDIVEYPTIIATMEDGQVRNIWRGSQLPTIDEVSYYVQ